MNDSWNRNNGDPMENMLDKITDAMDSLDFERLSNNIQASVDYIRKEAERGYRSFQNSNMQRGKNSGADQSWFKDGGNGGQRDVYGAYQEPGDNVSGEPHRASSGQYTYQYQTEDKGPHRASSGQYAPGSGQHYSPAGSVGKNAAKKLPAVIRDFPGSIRSIVEICVGAAGLAAVLPLLASLGLLFFFTGISGKGIILVLLYLAFNAGLLWHGISTQIRIGHFRKYNKSLAGKDYCMLEDLAQLSGQPLAQVKKDMKKLMKEGCMPGVTMDKNETCLLLTGEAKKQYEDAENARLAREIEEAHKKAMEEAEALKKQNATKEEKAWMEFDEEYQSFCQDLAGIREEMDTPVMREHVDKIDQLLTKVYDCVKDHHDMIGSTGHLTSYYYPCMSKLFHTYLDLEEQPIQGDNILKTKAEIEASFDTIEKALTNMYDEMFTNLSMDISSDIQVLNTIMARDGWSDKQMKAEKGGNYSFLAEEDLNASILKEKDRDAQTDTGKGGGFPAMEEKDPGVSAMESNKAAAQAVADDMKKAEEAAEKAAAQALNNGGMAMGGAAGAFAPMPEEKL